MKDPTYITLSASERELLQDALAALAGQGPLRLPEIHLLKERLTSADPEYPDITIGVYGGLVQWVIGNPFPIRICDYDGDGRELPDIDARGNRCSISFEPPSA